MTKGNGDYDSRFSKDPVGYGQREFARRFTLHELDRMVADRTASSPPARLPDPTEAEAIYLHSVFGTQQGEESETMVYETEDWIKRTRGRSVERTGAEIS